MYANLRRDLFNSGITQAQIAKLLGIGTNTVSKKMHGKTEFKSSEMIAIKREFFPDKTLEYLFDES